MRLSQDEQAERNFEIIYPGLRKAENDIYVKHSIFRMTVQFFLSEESLAGFSTKTVLHFLTASHHRGQVDCPKLETVVLSNLCQY